MKKTLLQLALTVIIVVAGYLLYRSLNAPIVFTENLAARSAEVVQKLKDIRTIEKAYKAKYGSYSDDFDELIRFVKNDSIVYEVTTGSEDDSVAIAEGRVNTFQVLVAARDTLFVGREMKFDEIPFIPFAPNGEKFILGTRRITTESGVEVEVFEAKAEYKIFLSTLDNSEQDIINLYDKRKVEEKYPGLKVGSLEKANNDAGNWEN